MLRNWSIVRGGASSTQKALFFNLRRLRAKLTKNGETISEDALHRQIATAVGMTKEDVTVMAARIAAPDACLNMTLGNGEGGTERTEFLVCDKPLPDETASEQIDRERKQGWLKEAMAELNEREFRILQERRLENDSATLETIAEKLRISKERVRQIESRALQKVKSTLLRNHPELIDN